MNLEAPIGPTLQEPNMTMLEQLVKEKARSDTQIKWVQYALVALELILYLVTYVILFIYKILPNYPEATLSNLSTWGSQIPVIDDYSLYFICFIGILLIHLYQKRFYRLDKESNLSDEIVSVITATGTSFLITIGITFLMKNTMHYSRVMLILFTILVIVETAATRYLRNWLLMRLKSTGVIQENILIVGAGRIGKSLLAQMRKYNFYGARFVGFLDDKESGSNIIGRVDELEQIIQHEKADIVYITIPSAREVINPLLQRLNKYQLDIRIVPEQFDHLSSIYEYRHDFNFPSMQVVKTPLRGINLLTKRMMDIVLSLLALIVLSPVLFALIIAIKTTSKGPVIYKQKRLGKNGLPFMMYKFRSMVQNAEELKQELLEKHEMEGPAFKLKRDPRITPIGTFLRKYSLDELPQLINVIVGDMSLIGPRPPEPEEANQYTDVHWRRLDVRPGMTGLWQVSGRSDVTFDERVDLDIQYIERWSLALEFKILLKTIPTVVKGSGAY
ncbi:sugar transferase [Cohnella lubricantis]|uniref:Sugar transferase n=1 Tax=Cohnella lubricantis TaxID=2163172 RepID=A0A841TIK8_9BACL|nr:sugar transferase [Cohnella lubricantis]MBB6678767.1 sugar transferase [Cohnella lubricantis]MBP2117851.1 exopolysaccharide biosynthesis polyprenyl glycosylphosphotransferase [Cohnella lubricantis]